MQDKKDATGKKVQQVVDLVRRLQSFHLEHAFEAVSKAPKGGGIKIRVRQWAGAGEEYRQTNISVLDGKALKNVDLAELKKKVSPEAYKAALLLQRDMSFDPVVLAEVSNQLPPGMIDIEMGGTGQMAAVGINININCKKIGTRPYWPVLEAPVLKTPEKF